MAEQVIDLIHRLSFELTGKGLDDTIRKLKEQAQGIDQLKLKEQELNQQMRKANNLNVNDMQKLSNERANLRKLIEQETKAVKDNFVNNKQLQAAIKQETQLINALGVELKRLGELRAQTTDIRQIRNYERQMAAAITSTSAVVNRGAIGSLNRSMSEFNSVGGSFNQILREIPNAGISARTFLVSLTNNVSYFAERIGEARQQGQSWSSIMGTMGRSLTGLVGVINIAILVLTYLSLEYDKNSKEAQELEEDTDSLTAAIVDQIRAVRELADLRRETNAILSESEAAAKRNIDLLKATGATELEIFQAEQDYHSLRIKNRKDEINSIVDVEKRAEQLFKFYTDQGLRTETVNEEVAKALAQTIKETTESTTTEAQKQSEAYVKSYRERNGKIVELEGARLRLIQEVNDIEAERNINNIEFQKKISEELKDDAAKAAREAARRAKQAAKSNSVKLLDIFDLSDAEQRRLLDQFDKVITDVQTKMDEFRNRRNTNASSLGREGFLSGPSGLNSVDSASDLPDLIQMARNQRDAEKEQEKKDKEARDKRVANINAVADAYTTAAQSIAQALDIIYQAQARSLDNEIRIREQRVEAATELAERGNAELLNLERQRLEAAQEERERVARRQIAVNAALQVSNSLVAVARAASEGGGYGSIALVAAVIAAIAAGYGAVQSLTADTEPGFREGIVGFKGKGTGTSDSNRVKISAGESIITAAGTEKNRAILEAINAGKVIDIPSYNIPVMQNNGAMSNSKGIEKRLDALIDKQGDGIKSIGLRADVRGFSLAVEKHTYNNRKRNSR